MELLNNKLIDLTGAQVLKTKLEAEMDSKDAVILQSAKDASDPAGTAATKVADLEETLSAVAKSGKAADVTIEDSGALIEASTVEAALAELATALSSVSSAGTITIEKSVDAEGVAARYTFKQGGVTLSTVIDIPKDMVVESGSVVTNPNGQEAGTYLKLVLANATEDEIYIPVDSLIEYVTSGSADGDMVVITVSEDHKVTAAITDGTITKAKLDSSVKLSLEKADSAIQSVSASDAESGTDGTITVDGTEVSVKGYSSLATDVADLKAAVGEGGGVSTQISDAIAALDADKTSAAVEEGKGLQVQVTEVDGKIDSVVVSGNFDNAYEEKGAADTAIANIQIATADEINALFATE